MPTDVPVATPEAAPNGSPPAAPPADSGSSEAASGGGDGAPAPAPLKAREHAAIEAAKFGRREAKREAKAAADRAAALERDLSQERQTREQLATRIRELEEKFARPLHGRADAEQVIRDFVVGETPEKKTADAIAEARRIAEEAKKELADERQKAEQREKYAREQNAAYARDQRTHGFAAAVTSGECEKQYQYLNAVYTKAEIRAMALEIDSFLEENSLARTFEQVAKHLDDRAKKVYESRRDPFKRLLAAEGNLPVAGLAPPNQTGRAGSSFAGNGHRASRPEAGARPLTGAALRAHERAQRDKQEAEDLMALRKASAADAAARNRDAKAASKSH